MKIQVTDSRKVWESNDGKFKIWDIILDNGSTLQTKSEKIAAGGEFEVEAYEKNGRSYVRQVAKQQSFGSKPSKSYQADPEKISSIEWQKSIGEGRQLVKDYYDIQMLVGRKVEGLKTLAQYKEEVVNAAITLASTIGAKPDHLLHSDENDKEEDFVPEVDDLPPVENYEESQ